MTLAGATVASVWGDIFHRPDDEAVLDDTLACIRWMYRQMEYGCQKYPGFFTHHSLSFMQQDTADGKRRMHHAWQHILDQLCVVLKRDPRVRPDGGSVEKVGVEPHPKRVGPASWNLEYG